MNSQRTFVAIAIVIIGAGLAAFALWLLFPKPDGLAELCRDVLPLDRRAGITAKLATNGVNLDVSEAAKSDKGASPEQIAAFVDCIERVTRKPVVVENAIYLKYVVPVGQQVDDWGPAVPRLQLMPSSSEQDNRTLNNLRIGPAVGTAASIIREWCSEKGVGRCVECSPERIDSATPTVEAKLRPNAQVEEAILPGNYRPPASGVQRVPWELFNSAGKRIFYNCKSKE